MRKASPRQSLFMSGSGTVSSPRELMEEDFAVAQGSFDMEPQSTFHVGDSMHHLLGYIQNESLEKCRSRMSETVYASDLQQTLEVWENSLKRECSYSLEYRIPRQDGSLIWVWDMGVLTSDRSGQPIINGVMVDVTGHRMAHERLRCQRDFFQSHYDTMPCGIVRFNTDEDPKLLHANKRAFEVIGRSPEDFAGDIRFLSIIHPEDYHFVKDRLGSIVRSGKGDAFIYRALLKSGETRWFNSTLNIVEQSDGTRVLQVLFGDATEAVRTQMEQKTTYASIPGGVVKFQVDNGVSLLEANDQYYQMLGASRDECHTRAMDAVLPSDRLNLYFTFIEQSALRKPVDLVYRCRRFDNDKIVWMHIMGHFVEMRGKSNIYQAVVIDITAQKEALSQLDNERERYRLATELFAQRVYEYHIGNDTLVVFERQPRNDVMEVLRHTVERFVARMEEHGLVHPADIDHMTRIFSDGSSGSHKVRFRTMRNAHEPFERCRIECTTLSENGQRVRMIGTICNENEEPDSAQGKKEILDVFEHELNRDYELVSLLDTKTGGYQILLATAMYFQQVSGEGNFALEVGKFTKQLVHPQDQGPFLHAMEISNMKRVLDQEIKEDSQFFRFKQNDGRWRWKCARYSYFRQNREKILLNVRDVHDIRMAQQRDAARFNMILRENCEKLMEVDVETGEYKMFLPDDNNKYPLDYCSNYGDLIKTYAQKYVLPEERKDFLHSLSLRMILQHTRHVDKPYTVDFTVYDTEGGLAYKSWHTILCRYEDREFLLSYIRDVTGRVLELREKEREADKNRRMIKDALDLAKLANRAKSDFLSKMSHEIRTPMNAIIGMSDIMGNDLDNKERISDCLSKIGSSSRYLLSLINDILDMSRIESGKLSLSQEEFSLEELMAQIGLLVSGQAKDKGIIFEMYYEGLEARCFVGDPLRLKQIIINLLSNALKFTAVDGTVTCTVEELRRVQEHSYLTFIVSDTGIGVSKEKLKRIFEPFEQAESNIGMRFGGSGLGLSITRNLVALMNGHISVTSSEGKGSTFRVELPLRMSGDGDKPFAHTAPAEKRDYDFSGKRILVVEDNDLNMEIAQTLLEFKNASVECAVNGRQGVEKFEASPLGYYSLILMDIQMPVMNGLAATQAIRAMVREDACTIPILAMTANAFAEDKEEAKASGMNEHLAKPMETEKLYQRLHYYFSKG